MDFKANIFRFLKQISNKVSCWFVSLARARRKKIVLIDEISELDPQNLENVKNTLKAKLEEGSLLLAVLVRPSSEMTQIKGWN